MAASVSAIHGVTLQIDETVAFSMDNAEDEIVRHELPVQQGVLNASSTVPATKAYSQDVAITGSTADIDLTSLPGPKGAGTVDFTGLKVQLAYLQCPSTNVAAVAIAPLDAVTGYQLFATTNATTSGIILDPGQDNYGKLVDKREAVDATHKDIRLTGVAGDVARIALVAG